MSSLEELNTEKNNVQEQGLEAFETELALSESGMGVDTLQTQELTLNLGPQHPSTHGVFRAVIKVDGEVVTGIDSRIGYLHRCFEKIAENRTYPQFVPYTDRMDYVSSMHNNWSYVSAVEKLADIELPERAEYIRVIVGEFNRIASHLIFLTTAGMESGAVTPYFYFFDEREKILKLYEQVCGARLTFNYIRIGGVSGDLPEGWIDEAKRVVNEIRTNMKDYDRLLFQNYIFKKRFVGAAPFSREDALCWGLTGPSLRASGVPYDVRKSDPYSVYPELDFDICIAEEGDNYARVMVRFHELMMSLRIIDQALDKIPTGPVMAEGIAKTFKPPVGEAFAHIESSRGDLGYYIVSEGTTKPYRVKVQGPSFGNLQAFKPMATGTYLADTVLTLGTLDPVFGEVDR
ncbi:MAG TPA: NADH-quinone oxidoreductase subunit D [Candidatus Aquicultor sp.]|jgi:NADH-quinone oxidoreductase subunit D